MSKRKIVTQLANYKVEVQDYGYKSRAPVAVRVSGLIDGECKNAFGEPCFFYKAGEAMTMQEGLALADQIVVEQIDRRNPGRDWAKLLRTGKA